MTGCTSSFGRPGSAVGNRWASLSLSTTHPSTIYHRHLPLSLAKGECAARSVHPMNFSANMGMRDVSTEFVGTFGPGVPRGPVRWEKWRWRCDVLSYRNVLSYLIFLSTSEIVSTRFYASKPSPCVRLSRLKYACSHLFLQNISELIRVTLTGIPHSWQS